MATSTLDVTLPIFIVMAVGAIAMFLKVVDGAFISKTNVFLFKVVLPIVVFRSMVNIPEFESDYLKVSLTYVITLVIIQPVLMALSTIKTKYSGKTYLERYQIALSSAAWSNTVILGIPLVTALFDESRANLYAVLQIAPTQIFFIPLNLIVLEIIKARRDGRELSKAKLAKMIGVRTATSPLMISVVLGLIVSGFIDIKKGDVIGDSFALIARILTPVGVVVAGAFLEKQVAILVSTARKNRRDKKAGNTVLDKKSEDSEESNEEKQSSESEDEANESEIEMVVNSNDGNVTEEHEHDHDGRTKHDDMIDEDITMNKPETGSGGRAKPCDCHCDCENMMKQKQKKAMQEIAKLEIVRPILFVICRMYIFPLIGFFVARMLNLDDPDVLEIVILYMALPTTFVSFAMQLQAKVEAHVTPIAILIGMALLPFHVATVRWFIEKMMR